MTRLGKDDDFERMRGYIATAQGRGINRLPPEPRLSEELQVSRGRLRTLLKRMESDGLIWRHVGKGTFIGRKQAATASNRVSESVSLEQVMQARLALEPQLAAQAAMHANQADLQILNAYMQQMKAETDLANWKKLDDALHLAIVKSSHNAMLLLLYETLKAEIAMHYEARLMAVLELTVDNDPTEMRESEHEVVVAAISQHDPVLAEKAMRDHILSVRSSIFGLV